MRGLIWTILLSLCSTAVLAQGVYRWVDEQGNVHYGDKPHGIEADEVKIRRPDPSEAPSSSGTVDRERLLRALEAERLERAEQRATRERERAERERRCFQARDELRRLETASALYELDNQGQRRILSDAEHSQALAKARGQVEQWCD